MRDFSLHVCTQKKSPLRNEGKGAACKLRGETSQELIRLAPCSQASRIQNCENF